jgi:hypothetical protein
MSPQKPSNIGNDSDNSPRRLHGQINFVNDQVAPRSKPRAKKRRNNEEDEEDVNFNLRDKKPNNNLN